MTGGRRSWNCEISRRAGVGMATLYRNFSGRRELLEAVYIFASFASKRQVASELLEHSDSSNPVFGESRPRVIAAGRPLLAAAHRTHEVRDDLAIEQVLDMVGAVAAIPGDARYLEPILQTALDGLRPPTGAGPEKDNR